MKHERERVKETDFKEEYEPGPLWEQIRDDDGIVVEGCYRKNPAPDSDNL